MQKTLLTFLFFVAFLASSTRMSAQPEFDVIDCGFTMHLTAVGTQMIGDLQPVNPDAPSIVSTFWYNAADGSLLQANSTLNYNMGGYGKYKIRVLYQTQSIDGQWGCVSSLEREIELIEPSCIQPMSLTDVGDCGTEYAPVCGCDGNTYDNECEAKKLGISTWWAGACNSQPPASTCGTTNFEVEVSCGSPNMGYDVKFTNLSNGYFTNTLLNFGDGTPIYAGGQWTEITHHYATGGVYNATLTAWNVAQPGCISSIGKILATDAYSMEIAHFPPLPEYVMPGDCNHDGSANVYDLLSIGKTYSTLGAPRPEASTDWNPQFAPDWTHNTTSGINYKHNDSNGDGLINEFDIFPVEMHYQPIQGTPSSTPAPLDGPPVYIQFDQDTVVINAAQQTPLIISADINIGSPDRPALGLYGLACALRYPEFVQHDPTLLYDPTFFGSTNYVLTLGHDTHDLLQYDFGVSHKSGSGASGYGRVAKLSMKTNNIIIIDIIDRAEAEIVPFVMPIEHLVAIDAAGNPMNLTATVSDTLWIKVVDDGSATNDLFQQGRVSLYPNPTKGKFNIDIAGSVEVEQIQIIDLTGRVVRTIANNAAGSALQIEVDGLAKGMYTVKVMGKDGVGVKQLVVD